MIIEEIRDEIIEETGNGDPDEADESLLSEILICIKGAIRRFATHARSRRLLTTAELSLLEGLNYASLPTDFINEREDGVYYKTDGKRTPIHRYHQSNYNELNTTLRGNPAYYWIIDDKIYFDKTAEVNMTIYLEHFKDESNINIGDTFYGTAEEIECIKDLAKFTYYFDYEEEESKGNSHLALAKITLDELDAKFMVKELPTHVEEA